MPVTQALLDTVLASTTSTNLGETTRREIEDLKFLPFEQADDASHPDTPLALVLVEARLLEDLPTGPASQELLDALERLKQDLWEEGLHSRALSVSLYGSSKTERVQQDGLTLLALRSFIKQCRSSHPGLRGVLLVGSFPEATLIWRCFRTWDAGNPTFNGTRHTGVRLLRIQAELVAPRTDIVLCDLDGPWETLYQGAGGPVQIQHIEAVPADTQANILPADGGIFVSKPGMYSVVDDTFMDVFVIDDHRYEILSQTGGVLRLRMHTTRLNPEVSAADRSATNPLSRPKIFVSRINPRHVALSVESWRDSHGLGVLDASGKPQTVDNSTLGGDFVWPFKRDAIVERRVLLDYLARDHGFRTGALSPERRVATIGGPESVGTSGDAAGMSRWLGGASSEFASALVLDKATVAAALRFLRNKALIKGVVSHANYSGLSLTDGGEIDAVADAAGRPPWRWRREGSTSRFVPSFDGEDGRLKWDHLYTMYQNQTLAKNNVCFYLTEGCEVLTPGNVMDLAYGDDYYGGLNIGESLLFFGNGLALIARTKVFNDRPEGLPEALAASPLATFADGWKAYYDWCASRSFSYPNKSPYFWSFIGDFALRLCYDKFNEDLLYINSSGLNAIRASGGWTITDGRQLIYHCASEAQAQAVLRIMQTLRLDRVGYVGRPDPSMTYWLSGGRAPAGRTTGATVVAIDPGRIELTPGSAGTWRVACNQRVLFVAPSFVEADRGARVIRRYRFTAMGVVGKGADRFTFFTG